MKTIKIISIAFICLMATVVIYSCSKEKPANPVNLSVQTNNNNANARATVIRSFQISDCFAPPVNCLPDVVVTRETSHGIANLDSLILIGKVQQFAHSPDRIKLFPGLNGKPLSDLLTGSVTLMKNPMPAWRNYVNYSIVYHGATNPLDGPNYGE